jgi:ribosome-binding protein aMBF1 (putative translation factor)
MHGMFHGKLNSRTLVREKRLDPMAKQGPGKDGKPTGPLTHTTRQPEATPAVKRRPRKAESKPASRTDTLAANTDEAPSPLQILFGENLRTARLIVGLSQAELAARSGLTQQYLSKVETGHKNVTLRTMAALAEAVGREVSVLLRHPRKP